MARALNQRIARFRADESGAMTAWNIFWVIIFILTMGLAIDLSNAHRYRMALQATADSAALTAAMAYDRKSKYETFTNTSGTTLTPQQRGRDAADVMAKRIMGETGNKDVLDEVQDIKYGNWTPGGGFVEDPIEIGHYVQAVARRSTQNANQLETIFLGVFGGLPSWDLAAMAVAQRYRPACERNGIITLDVVDFQSQNTWNNGICIHGERGIQVNQNNYYDWEDDVIVSVPSYNLISAPEGDMSQNYGLEEALRYGSMVPQLAVQAPDIIAALSGTTFTEWHPDYLVPNAYGEVNVLSRPKNAFDPATMQPGNVYNINCESAQGNNTLNLRGIPTDGSSTSTNGNGGQASGPSIISQVVIVTDCNVVFDSGTLVTDAIIATTSTNSMSMKGSAGVNIGLPDNCAAGGGAQLISLGGMNFAASMGFHGSQIVTRGTTSFAAQVSGMGGTSVQSTARVELASVNDMSLCDGYADPDLESFYYRLVQ